jgi:4-amino-4-deoxy-L-arabinose transferase-like glycosyltransferase
MQLPLAKVPFLHTWITPAAFRFRKHVHWLPFLFVALLVFSRLGHRDLISSHEARAAQHAQYMLETGNWGLPTLLDERIDLQKPPAYYWLVATVGWLQGGVVNEWAARLPAALAGLLCVGVISICLRAEGRPTAAVIALLVLATANHYMGIARTARIDIPLTCAVTLSLIAFRQGCCPFGCPSASPGSVGLPAIVWHCIAAVSAAAAVLLKGPVALALIGPAAVAWIVVERPRVPRVSWLVIPLIVAGVSLPWYVWANHVTDGELVRVFFWHHTIARYAGTSPLLAAHPWWYYLPRFAIDFLPWTPLLVGLIGWSIHTGRWQADPTLRFGLIVFAMMFLVLSTARFKRADYLLPAYPFAAIVLGCAAEAWSTTRRSPRSVRVGQWLVGIALVTSVCIWLIMHLVVEPALQAREEKRAFASLIRQHAPPPHTILQFRMESHLLSYHLGRPLRTLVEWGELNELLSEPGPHFVVMPPEYVHAARQIITSRRLVVLGRLEDVVPVQPNRSLVFLRTND